MTFSYFVLYIENATSYGYHVNDFFTPYNERNNMTCITTRLEHFEFSSAWGGLSAPRGVCVYFSYGIPETVEWVNHGESFYIGEIKITGGAMPCPACSQVNNNLLFFFVFLMFLHVCIVSLLDVFLRCFFFVLLDC